MITNQRESVQERVRAFIEAGELGVVFQPIVSVRTGRIVAFEALSRPNADSGFVSPGRLFKAAEEAGLLWELEVLAREKTFRAARNWPEGVKLFFNNSPTVLADERFAASIEQAAGALGSCPRDRLVAEITELSEESMNKALVARAQQLKDAGFGVAIDDVGAGRSGMNRIVQIRPQWIKLDSQFVRTIHADPIRQNLVRFFVHFARLSGIELIAEGVETADELAVLTSLDVPYAQGFYLSHPVSRETVGSPELAKDVARRWRVTEAHLRDDTRALTSVGRLCEPAPRVQVGVQVKETAAAFAEHPHAAGAIVMDGDRVAGWAWRAQLERMNTDGFGGVPVGEAMRPSMVRVLAGMTLHDALEMASSLEDQAPADPLLVCDGETIEGVVRLRDLIRVAMREGRVGSGGASITRLPGRVEADRHLQDQIDAWKGGATHAHGDVAFIDIRQFADCNARFGYASGDRLIRCLADLLEAETSRSVTPCFAAHLGDDRFVMTTRPGELGPRMCHLIEQFDQSARGFVASAEVLRGAGHGAPQAPPPRLRVILLDNALSRARTIRDLFSRERALKAGDERAASAESAASAIIVDEQAAAA